MTEENGNVDPNATTTVVEGDSTPPLVDEHGVLRENWHEVLDEDLRDESYLKEVKDIQGMARSTVNARRMVGKNKMAIPNKDSTEDEWKEFYEAGGRPKTAADYNLTRPEDIPEEYWHQEYADGVQEILFKFGGSKRLAEALFEFDNKFKLGLLKTKTEADKAAYKKAEDDWYRECGNAFEERTHLGNMAIEKGTTVIHPTTKEQTVDEEFKKRLCGKFGNDIDFVRFTSNLGKMFAEHGDVAIPGIPTPGDIQQQIDEGIAHLSYGLDYRKHGFTREQHEAQIDKVARLFRAKVESTTKRHA